MELLFQWGSMLGSFWPTSAEDQQSALTRWVSQDDDTFPRFKHGCNTHTHARRSLFHFVECLVQHRTSTAPSTGSMWFFFSPQWASERNGIIDRCLMRPVISLRQKKCSFWWTSQIGISASLHTHKHVKKTKAKKPLFEPDSPSRSVKIHPVNRSLKRFFFIGMEKCLAQVKKSTFVWLRSVLPQPDFPCLCFRMGFCQL